MNQYDRLIKLINHDNFKLLKNTTVAVIGLGGVGGYAVECLARSGIGKLIIIDYDTIDITNLNRQIITTKSNVGKKKSSEAKNRIEEISNTTIECMDIFLDENNLDILFKNKFDYLIDACDTINTKKIIIKECLNRNISFISCMGTGRKLDFSKYEITDIRKTSYDPLAKQIRKYVNDENLKGEIPVLYSKEIPKEGRGEISSICYMPAIAGMMCSGYIINKIIKNTIE